MVRAKNWMLSTLWGESFPDIFRKAFRSLHFASGVARILEDAFILPHDIQAVLAGRLRAPDTNVPHRPSENGIRPVYCNKISLILEQAVGLPGGQLLHNAERFQMAKCLVDCR